MGAAEKMPPALPERAQAEILRIVAAGQEAHVKLVRGELQVIEVCRRVRCKAKLDTN